MIPVFDHGFLYGDSIYETFRTVEGYPLQLSGHIDRLFRSARPLELKIPLTKHKIASEILKTIKTYWKKHTKEDLYIRVIVTRGVGDIGFDPELCPRPSWMIIAKKFVPAPEKLYKTGIKISLVSTIRNHPKSIDPKIKSGNYLNNLLAYLEARRHHASDAVMPNIDGYITEATTNSVFLVKKGVLLTPSLDSGILESLTRELIIEIAKKNHISVREKKITKAEFLAADECFLAGSLKGILPVTQCDLKKIGKGRVGPITQKLLHLLNHAILS